MKIINRISVIFLFLLINSSSAQVRLGMFGGINSTGIAGDNPPNASFTDNMGYEVGAIAEFNVLDDVVINFQPMYSDRSSGIEYDVKYQYEPYDSIRINIESIEVPFNVKVIADNNISYVTAGLVLSVPLSHRAINNRTNNEMDVEDRFESLVWKANFGVGIQFNVGKSLMFIDLSYTQSLTNLTKIEINEISLNSKTKSNSIQLNVGIMFSL